MRASLAVVLLALLVVEPRAAGSTSFQTPIPPTQAGRGAARPPGTTAGGATTDAGARVGRPWSRVHLSHPIAAALVRRVLDEVSRRMGEPRCQALLDRFQDQRGRRLSDRLGDLRMDVQQYLDFIIFLDGNFYRCRGRLAYTAAGSRIVYLCPGAVERRWHEDREGLVATLIHEVLHTLGLGEDPPSSAEITDQARRRCGSGTTRLSRSRHGRALRRHRASFL